MMSIDKETICNRHNEILFRVKQIEKELATGKGLGSINWDNVFTHLLIINTETKLAKKSGQRMENRLNKYLNCIEKLGFKRIGK